MLDESHDLRWGVPQLLAAFDDWGQLNRVKAQGVPVAVSFAPMPDRPETFNGLRFVPLHSYQALAEEGRAMHHCVANYWRDVAGGRCCIYGVRAGDEPVATLEVCFNDGAPLHASCGAPVIGALSGFANKPVSRAVRAAVATFLTVAGAPFAERRKARDKARTEETAAQYEHALRVGVAFCLAPITNVLWGVR
jgi:hypothetical protein